MSSDNSRTARRQRFVPCHNLAPVHSHTFFFERILGRFAFGNVNDSVHVEADFLGVRGPGFVAEAVLVAAVGVCFEGVIARADAAFVDLIHVVRFADLRERIREHTVRLSYVARLPRYGLVMFYYDSLEDQRRTVKSM